MTPESITLLIAVAGLLAALGLYVAVGRWPTADAATNARTAAIRHGARLFLTHEYIRLAPIAVAASIALGWTLGPAAGAAFLAGALLSGLASAIGMAAATRANVRTAVAARDRGRGPALSAAFSGGAVMGVTVSSLGLLGLASLILLLGRDGAGTSTLSAFGMGASAVALFARVGGGIFTKGADIGADLVGKIETGLEEDDARNPGVIADNVGDNVGDVAGMGADLFESYCGAIIAASAIALVLPQAEATALGGRASLLALPLALCAAGLVASLLALGLVYMTAGRRPDLALGLGVGGATTLFLVTALVGVHLAALPMALWLAVLAGSVAGIVIGGVTELYTRGRPVSGLAEAAETGAATVVIRGIALGMESAALPVIAVGVALYAATELAGLYGVALAATGMLATTGMVMAIDAYGPIADNAGGLAQMGDMGSETRAITDELDAIGNTTAAIGKGYAIGAAALTALALMSAYVETVRQAQPGFVLDLADPMVLLGGFIGALLPFLFSAMTMTAVGRTAQQMIVEIRRQLREIPGLREGKVPPDSDRCTDIASNAALTRMLLPGGTALAVPILVGVVLGPGAVGGMLGVALPTGVVLALFLANAGGAWDNAKKLIERGAHGGKGSAAHDAAVIGDTVGDPFKDTAGPSMNILIKLLGIVSLTIAPLLL
ncbi:sodium-translocating pyrophosphatase [Halofilum ochraceum]|uniref:sodium-translocating pyrophosphatase n=1 Tax=Halofilum ochraceum TaxID=1611323 RepID=UPI0008D9F9CD|nr:sodium-translocating pyrophosphatase [Halofilum ochraceum]